MITYPNRRNDDNNDNESQIGSLHRIPDGDRHISPIPIGGFACSMYQRPAYSRDGMER